MSVVNNVITACPTLQVRLNEAFGIDTRLNADEKLPHLQFMLSPENTRGITQMIAPGGGKIRSVQVTYWQRKLESTVQSNQPNPNCGVGQAPENNFTNYSLDTSVNYQTEGDLLTAQEVEAVCDPNSGILEQLILRDMDVLDRKVATVVANQSAALFGGWSTDFTTGNAVGDVNASSELVIATVVGGVINPRYHNMIFNALDDVGFPANPFIVGGTTLREAFQLSANGCCTNEGIDLRGMFDTYGYVYAFDRRMQAALGSSLKAIVLAPGAQQVLQYNRAQWRDGMRPEVFSGANYVHMTLVSPKTGARYDWTLEDDCGSITSNLTWTGKVVGLPRDLFNSADIYPSLVYANKLLVTNS